MRLCVYICCLLCNTLVSMQVQHALLHLYQSLDELHISVTSFSSALQELRENPARISQRNNTFLSEVARHAQSQEDAYQKITSRLKRDPLICFFECNSPQACALSRESDPGIRDAYDRRISERLIQKQPSDDGYREYTTIASGGLLQDLRVVSLALEQQPSLKLRIHCIEKDLDVFTRLPIDFIYRKPSTSGAFERQQNIFDTKANTYIKASSTISRLGIKINTHKINIIGQPQYMLHVLREAYPKADIQMCIYASTQQYAKLVQGASKLHDNALYYIPMPHVIGCCDAPKNTFKEISSNVNSIIERLQQTQSAPWVVYLMKFEQSPAVLAEISNTKFKDSKPYQFKDIVNLMKWEYTPQAPSADVYVWHKKLTES